MSEQELLMKTANGEIKDKTKVKFDDGVIYEFWEEDEKFHGFLVDERRFGKSPTRTFSLGRLSNKVELIEEDKEISKITKEEFERLDKRTLLELIVKNQNELIDEINELKKGK